MHVELNFDVRSVLRRVFFYYYYFVFCRWLSNCSRNICWKKLSLNLILGKSVILPYLYKHLCLKSVDCSCIGLFLDPLFHLVDLNVYFVPVWSIPDNCNFAHKISEARYWMSSNFVLLFQLFYLVCVHCISK